MIKRVIIFRLFSIITISTVLIVIAFLFFAPIPEYNHQFFTSLDDLLLFAQSIPEYEPMTNANTLRPEFAHYYQQFEPTLSKNIENKARWLLSQLHVIQPPHWTPYAFKKLLLETTQQRELQKITGKQLIAVIDAQQDAKLIVFGNIQGSLHSFTRDLEHLIQLQIFDESLRLINSSYYIIFMGNIINRSHLSLETLSITLRLMQRNPNNIIYLRGTHESRNYWQEHTLKTELQTKTRVLSQSLIPLEEDINRFFATLPIALYIAVPKAKNTFVRISHAGRTETKDFSDERCAIFLNAATNKSLRYFKLPPEDDDNHEEKTQSLSIPAIIRGEKKRESFQKMEGLRLLTPDLDSVAWNILSCPNLVYQKAIGFFHDAFVIITPKNNIKDWTITLYNRDVRTEDLFKETTYNLLTATTQRS